MGQGMARKKLEFEITCDIALCNCRGEFFKGMGGFNVTDVRRERIPLLWSTVDSRKNSIVQTRQRFLF